MSLSEAPQSSKRPDTMARPSLQPSARGRAVMLIVFLVILSIACYLPALILDGALEHWRGIELLVMGPVGFKHMQFAWLANLLALFALYRVMNKPGAAVVVITVLALAVAMDSLTLFGVVIPIDRKEEHLVRVVGYGPGFYVWLLALAWPVFALTLLSVQPPSKVRGDFTG